MPRWPKRSGRSPRRFDRAVYQVALPLNLTTGYRDIPLSECSVLGVHGLSGTDAAGKPLTPAEVGTVYVDVNCPEDDD